MQQVPSLNVNAGAEKEEGREGREPIDLFRPETEKRIPNRENAPFSLSLSLFYAGQRGGDVRRSRLWNAASPDPSCTVRIFPTCPACSIGISRRRARKRESRGGGGRRQGKRKPGERGEGRNRFIGWPWVSAIPSDSELIRARARSPITSTSRDGSAYLDI